VTKKQKANHKPCHYVTSWKGMVWCGCRLAPIQRAPVSGGARLCSLAGIVRVWAGQKESPQ